MRIKNIIIKEDVFHEVVNIITELEEPDSMINFINGCQISFEKHSYLNQGNYLLVILILGHLEKLPKKL